MAPKVDIYNNEWVDMVFQEKNQAYGAYILRKDNSRRHLKSFVIASAIFVLAVSSPLLMKYLIPKSRDIDTSVRMLEDIKLDQPKKDPEIARALQAPPPAVRNTIKFTPPVIKPDEEVSEEDEPKTQEEVMSNNAAVGSVNFDKGSDDIAAPVATSSNITEDTGEPFTIVEQMPEFPGGNEEMFKFLSNNIRYPVMAQENGVTGMVILSFVVSKSGKISNITVLRGIGSGCDEEAIRVVKKMPDWKPGRQGGNAVPVKFTLPVRFSLR